MSASGDNVHQGRKGLVRIGMAVRTRMYGTFLCNVQGQGGVALVSATCNLIWMDYLSRSTL